MHIQFSLQAECEFTGIKYPRAELHKNKEGHLKQDTFCMLSMLTSESISAGVGEAKREAQEEIELLGMAESLQKIIVGNIHQFLF